MSAFELALWIFGLYLAYKITCFVLIRMIKRSRTYQEQDGYERAIQALSNGVTLDEVREYAKTLDTGFKEGMMRAVHEKEPGIK